MPQLRCAAVVPRHLSLLDLKPGDCRYPYGGDSDGETMTFCGHPCRSGSSYCTPHFHLSRDPEATARTVLSAAWLQAIGAG
nr:GcrA family cell cycle regulator [Bradyrhizobium elkanii]